jgi:hypothetical protein
MTDNSPTSPTSLPSFLTPLSTSASNAPKEATSKVPKAPADGEAFQVEVFLVPLTQWDLDAASQEGFFPRGELGAYMTALSQTWQSAKDKGLHILPMPLRRAFMTTVSDLLEVPISPASVEALAQQWATNSGMPVPFQDELHQFVGRVAQGYLTYDNGAVLAGAHLGAFMEAEPDKLPFLLEAEALAEDLLAALAASLGDEDSTQPWHLAVSARTPLKSPRPTGFTGRVMAEAVVPLLPNNTGFLPSMDYWQVLECLTLACASSGQLVVIQSNETALGTVTKARVYDVEPDKVTAQPADMVLARAGWLQGPGRIITAVDAIELDI